MMAKRKYRTLDYTRIKIIFFKEKREIDNKGRYMKGLFVKDETGLEDIGIEKKSKWKIKNKPSILKKIR